MFNISAYQTHQLLCLYYLASEGRLYIKDTSGKLCDLRLIAEDDATELDKELGGVAFSRVDE